MILQQPLLVMIIIGLLAGFTASKIVNSRGMGFFLDIVLGIVGAFVGGWIFNYFGWGRVTGLNLMSILIAVVGGVILLVLYHAIFHNSRRHRF
jgi:uncharacterized membrane protein YeaQ/YmgE (transglycosylase-associated protein family)